MRATAAAAESSSVAALPLHHRRRTSGGGGLFLLKASALLLLLTAVALHERSGGRGGRFIIGGVDSARVNVFTFEQGYLTTDPKLAKPLSITMTVTDPANKNVVLKSKQVSTHGDGFNNIGRVQTPNNKVRVTFNMPTTEDVKLDGETSSMTFHAQMVGHVDVKAPEKDGRSEWDVIKRLGGFVQMPTPTGGTLFFDYVNKISHSVFDDGVDDGSGGSSSRH